MTLVETTGTLVSLSKRTIHVMIEKEQACSAVSLVQSLSLVTAEIVVTVRLVIAIHMIAKNKKQKGE